MPTAVSRALDEIGCMSLSIFAVDNNELKHYGVKGMKWGVRRSKEELATARNERFLNEFAQNPEMVITSKKGFQIAGKKIVKYLLDENGKHSVEFFNAGYKKDEPLRLLSDLEKGFDVSKVSKTRVSQHGTEQFQIPMQLGIGAKKTFLTAWEQGSKDGVPKFTSAYRWSRGDKK